MTSGGPGAVQVQRLYAPVDDVRGTIHSLVAGSKTSIYFAMYALTDADLIQLLAAKHAAGIVKLGVLDSTQFVGQPEQKLIEQHWPNYAEVCSVGTSEKGAIMHLKEFAIDGKTLITGSTNASVSGQTLQDNSLTVISGTQVVAAATARFQAIHAYQAAHPPAPSSATERSPDAEPE